MILIITGLIIYYYKHRTGNDGSSSSTKTKGSFQNKRSVENINFGRNLMKKQRQMMETAAPIMLTKAPLPPSQPEDGNCIEIPVVCGEMVIISQNDYLDLPINIPIEDSNYIPALDSNIAGNTNMLKIPSQGEIMKTRSMVFRNNFRPMQRKY